MKRLMRDGRNEQEGRQLIRAQSNGEKVALLGLSFKGGVAGPRTYSRRQALGLLGGSLAGFSLLSTGLANLAKSQVGDIKYGSLITLKSLGDKPGPRYLDGRTHNATVGLAPHTKPPYTGTRWRVSYVSDYFNTIVLHCEGTGPGNARLLDGRTQDRTVGLAPNTEPPYTGTEWRLSAHKVEATATSNAYWFYSLYCKGAGPGDVRYLDGRTDAGDVVLSPHLGKPFTGTHWQIDLVPVDKYGDPLPQ